MKAIVFNLKFVIRACVQPRKKKELRKQLRDLFNIRFIVATHENYKVIIIKEIYIPFKVCNEQY